MDVEAASVGAAVEETGPVETVGRAESEPEGAVGLPEELG